MTINDIIEEIEYRLANAKEAMRDSISAGYNSPGFNQDLGGHDTLTELLSWIKEENT
jgi:hypothetical protein